MSDVFAMFFCFVIGFLLGAGFVGMLLQRQQRTHPPLIYDNIYHDKVLDDINSRVATMKHTVIEFDHDIVVDKEKTSKIILMRHPLVMDVGPLMHIPDADKNNVLISRLCGIKMRYLEMMDLSDYTKILHELEKIMK
jgi:hypothetical protein